MVLALALCCALAQEAAPSAGASSAASDDACWAALDASRAACGAWSTLVFDARATRFAALANELWLAQGSAKLARASGSGGFAALIECSIDPPGDAPAFAASLACDGARWTWVDHGSRTAVRGTLPIPRGTPIALAWGLVPTEYAGAWPAREAAMPPTSISERTPALIAGESCRRFELAWAQNEARLVLALSERDRLPRIAERTRVDPLRETWTERVQVTKLALGGALEPASLALDVPAGYAERPPPEPLREPEAPPPQPVADLGASLEPFAAAFDAGRGALRMVAVLGPT
jgi:hypothetical protein